MWLQEHSTLFVNGWMAQLSSSPIIISGLIVLISPGESETKFVALEKRTRSKAEEQTQIEA